MRSVIGRRWAFGGAVAGFLAGWLQCEGVQGYLDDPGLVGAVIGLMAGLPVVGSFRSHRCQPQHTWLFVRIRLTCRVRRRRAVLRQAKPKDAPFFRKRRR